MLLVTPCGRAAECAAEIEKAIGDVTEYAESSREAAKLLRVREYSAVVIDEYLIECDPEGADVVLQHTGNAVPVYVNLAISGAERVVRELRNALRRHEGQRTLARRTAESALRNELRDSITAMLLSCELALDEAELPAAAAGRIRSVYELAKDMRARLALEEATV